MIRWAITGPTPVISSSFCLSAVLMLILVDCSGVGLGVVEGDGISSGAGVGVVVGVVVGDEAGDSRTVAEGGGVSVGLGAEIGVGIGVWVVEGVWTGAGATDGINFAFGAIFLEGTGVAIASMILADCGTLWDALFEENKNRLPIVASPKIVMIKSFEFNYDLSL